MKYKNILVTGGRGFIMFNGLQLWKKLCPDTNFYSLDANTYADKFMQNLKNDWLNKNGIPIIELNLADSDSYDKLCLLIDKYHIDAVIHGAAESHVDNSISNPNVFFSSNIIGTVNVLNAVKKYNLRLTVVSTDEVYGTTYPDDECYEDHMLDPSSPYSSSKCSADLIALSYFKTFGTKVTVSRCTNNFGKFQHSEKLIPTIITKALNGQKIPVYGKGDQRRHWIHVDEHNRAVMKILENGEFGKIYNIAPPKKNWISNIELIKFILNTLSKSSSLIEHVADRLGHDKSYFLYGTDFCQSTKEWQNDMKTTISWYKENI